MMTMMTATTEQYMPPQEVSHQWYDLFVVLVGLVKQKADAKQGEMRRFRFVALPTPFHQVFKNKFHLVGKALATRTVAP